MKKYKISIVGSGALGSIIGNNISKELSQYYELLGVLSKSRESSSKLSEELNCKSYNSLDDGRCRGEHNY